VAKLLRQPDTSWVQRKIALTVGRNSAPPVAAAELAEGTLSTSSVPAPGPLAHSGVPEQPIVSYRKPAALERGPAFLVRNDAACLLCEERVDMQEYHQLETPQDRPLPDVAQRTGATNLPLNVRQVRVRMHHTDLVGAVYHGRYFDLFEDARTEVFRDLGYSYQTCTEDEGRLMVIVHAACDFKQPARMDDLLVVAVTVPAITRVKVTFAYDVRKAGSPTLLARGEQVFAFLDCKSGRPTSVPPLLVTLIGETAEFGWDGHH
jgi:acyl-CoA thioester hydrolase